MITTNSLNRWKISVSLTLAVCHSVSTCGLEIETKVETGIDTYLATRHPDGFSTDGEGCCANNVPQGEPLSGHNTMEVDTNQGGTGPVEPLIYFDLDFEPEPGMGSLLDRFNGTPGATATLQINVSNGFDPLILRRIIVDWLSGPDGGNNISRITFPEAPLDDTVSAFIDGINVEPTANTIPDPAFVNQATGIITTDVTGDVAAWASGVSNYGWAGLPGASQGGLISTFEEADPSLRPKLIIQGPEGRRLKPLDGSTYVSLVTPRPNAAGISPNQSVFVEILNGDDPVNPESLALSIDGQEVEAVMNTIDGGVTLSWTPTGLSLAAAQINAEVSFSNQGTPNTLTTENWTYQVSDYATITSGLKIEDSLVNKNQPGFNISIHQMESGRPSGNNLPDPVRQVRGELIDDVTGAPFENLVDTFYPGEENKWVPNPSFTDSQIFQEEGVINYEQGARDDPNAGEGNIQPDKPIPGIPGITISTDNIAFEATTILELEAGFHRMGVNSDDGFVLSSSLNPLDALSVELGLFNGGRGDADTIIDFLVEESGLYPFTLHWWEGGGGASVEWFSVDTATGDFTLINDTSNADAIKAYRTFTGSSSYVASVTPGKNAMVVPPDTSIEAVLVDLGNASVELMVNGQAVTPTTTTSGSETTVKYDPPAPFAQGSTVTVGLIYGDLSGGWSFDIQSGEKVLLVQGTAAPNAADSAIIVRLESFGFDVAVVEDVPSQTRDADNAALIIVSSTSNSGDVSAKYRDLPIPVINWENALQDEFLTAINAQGTTGGQTEIEIVDANHPLAAGLSAGVHTVTTAPATFSWGVPNENASVVATLNDGSGNPVIYGYETGAVMDDGVFTAPARRLQLFLENDTFSSLNEDGLKLFDAALSWALDRSLEPVLAGDATISVGRSANGITIAFEGILQSADSVTGPYTDVADASSPTEISFSGSARFFRARR